MRGHIIAAVVALSAAFAAFSPARAEEGLCIDFADGDVGGLIDERTRCELRARDTIDGRQYLYAEIAGFRRGGRADYVDRARETVQRAVSLFNRWYETPQTIILFGNTPLDHRDALGLSQRASNLCAVYIDDSALRLALTGDEPYFQFQRTVAHELFHCVQWKDARMGRSMSGDFDAWWMEASAEYFAGLAFPAAAVSAAYYGGFADGIVREPLYRLGEGAYPWFAFLGRRRGPAAVVEMLRHTPLTNAAAEDRAMLRSVPGVDELFLDFAKAFFDGLEDDAGRRLPVAPPALAPVPIDRPGRLRKEVVPFRIQAARLVVPARRQMRVAAPTGPGDVRAALADAPGGWRPLAADLGACGGDTDGMLAFVSAQDSEGPHENVFAITERGGVMSDCPCPVGSWTITPADMETMKASANAELTSPGSVTMTFDVGGQARFQADGVTSRYARSDGRQSFSTTWKRDYLVSWTWSSSGELLRMTQNEGMRITETTTEQVSASYGSGAKTSPPKTRVLPIDASSGRERRFRCEGDRLIIGPPIVKVNGRVIDNSLNDRDYPHWGVFVRQ